MNLEHYLSVKWLLAICFPLVMSYAIICDLLTLKIPNWISIAVAIAFLPMAMLADIGFKDIATHYAVGLLLFTIGALLFIRGIMGGGDVKLLAATSIWIGWDALPAYLFIVSMLGGLLALIAFFLKRSERLPAFLASLPWLSGAVNPKENGSQPIPYAVAIGTAAILLFNHLSILR